MKKSSILIVAALLIVASCFRDEILDLQQDTPIGFRASLDKQSKAVSYTLSNLTTFNVTAWQSGYSHSGTAFIDQVDYNLGTDGAFTSDVKYFWPATDGLDFYVYAPKSTATNGLTRISEVSYSVTPLADTDNQIDFIFARNSGTKDADGANGVALNFRHAMSQIRVKVKNCSEAVKFNVTGWKIVGVDGSAIFTFDDSNTTGTQAANSQNTFSASMWMGNDDSYTASYSKTFTARSVTSANTTWSVLDGTAILVPQTAPMATGYANTALSGAYLAIQYEALSAEHNEEIVASGTWGCWPVEFAWAPGFCYIYTVDLADFGYEEQGSGELDPIIDDAEIKFVDVTVDLWQAGESGSTSPSEPKYLRFHTEGGTQTLYMVNFMNISNATETDLEYSTDEGATWTTLPMSDGNGSNGVEFGESNNTVTDLLIRGNGFGNRFDGDQSTMVVRSFAFEDPNQLVDCTGSLTSLIDYNDTTCTMTNMGHFIALFGMCEALRTAPELPFTELTEYCYASMFQDCSNLLRAPVLPAATLKTFCYGEMFEGCSSLNYVKALFIDVADDCLYYWLDDVAPTGTFIRNDLATWRKDEAEIPAGWTVKPYDSFLRFHVDYGLQSMKLMDMTDNQTETHLEYSLDGTNWSELQFNTAIEFGNDGTDNVDLYLRGKGFYNSFDMNNGPTKASVITFSENYYVYCSGNVGALSDYDNPTAPLTEDGQFAALFSGCTALVTAPDFPATDLTAFCYYGVFANCEHLVAAPALPATTLAMGCYYSMFEDCSGLETAPELPATTLEIGCYYSMFNGCTSLETAPELPATTLAMACYYSMFENCSNLITAPELPATTLAEMCYSYMFEGCSSLNYVKALFIDVEDDCLDDWLDGVASTGTFIKNDLATWSDSEAEIPAAWTVRPESYTPPSYDPFLRFHTEGGTQTLYMVLVDGDADETNLEYSTDEGATWNTLLLSNDSVDNGVQFGEENNVVTDVLVRGSGFSNDLMNGTIKAFLFGDEDQLVDCTGNIMCLIDYSDLTCEMTNAGQFAGLFYNCKALRTAPDLPATNLTPACYFGLFIMCSNLSAAPELPATTLAQQCYSSMFGMCSSLTAAPELPATTLAEQCYNSMFGMCSSLTAAPELPATTLVDGCYNEMFEGCSSLNYVKAMFLDVVDDCLDDWLKDVAATGTFIRHDLASWNKAEAGIPDDWDVVDAND